MSVLNNIWSKNSNCKDFGIIIGDININVIGVSSIDNDYLDILSMWEFKSFINLNMRTPINAKYYCIDNISVKNNNLINTFQGGVFKQS